MSHINIPNFPFSGHYYQEILEDLIRFMRANVKELTDEDPTEPHIQLLRAWALASHLSNVSLDMVANEMFLPTCKLRSSTRNLLALIGVQLKQAAPASADVVYELTRRFSSTTTILKAESLFGTLETPDSPAIEFEVLADVSTIRTDRLDKCYAYNKTADAFTDHSVEAQAPAGTFSPAWGTAENGDLLYIGHPDIMVDQLDFTISVAASGIVGTWEHYESDLDQGNPTSVTNLGDRLRFNVNSLLGTADRTGAVVRVRSTKTGGFEDIASTFTAGENRIETTPGAGAFLGQGTPSTTATDYSIGSNWLELVSLVDSTSNLSSTGNTKVTFDLPQTATRNWGKVAVGTGALAATQHWLRYRVISASAPTLPTIDEIKINQGKQYQLANVTQGRSREDNPLASSDATPDQTYDLVNSPVIDSANLKVFVNESAIEKEYEQVDNFLNSLPTDRHYTVAFDDDGVATITFGDGTNGKIPPAGTDNIRAEYRTMAEDDGNVGSDTITVNRSGAAFIANIANPRPATGFAEREGGDNDSIASLKISGPASLRALGRAVGPADVEQVATEFVAADGSRPVQRAYANEEEYGPNTVGLNVVGVGGAAVAAAKLAEIDDYFNGTATKDGVLLLNRQVTTTNFTSKSINVTATVTGGELAPILTALTALLNPLSKNDDGTFVWEFGGTLRVAKIIQEIMNTTPSPSNVVLTVPAADVSLGADELPTAGTLTITIV